MKNNATAGLTVALIMFCFVSVSNASLVDYSVNGDFYVTDYYDDGEYELNKRFSFTGNMLVENEVTAPGDSRYTQFAIEQFLFFMPELNFFWSGRGGFNFGSSYPYGDGYMALAGDTSQGQRWNVFSSLHLNEPTLGMPTIFSLNGFTIGRDESGSDPYFIDMGRPNHAGDFNYSLTAPPAPVPEPTTVLLFSSGLSGLIWCRRKRKN